MGIFDLFKSPDINQGVGQFQETPGAVLLDVRTPEEYAEGHIPGSKNIPLQALDRIRELTEDAGTPLFTYCLSGARSRQAVSLLRSMGYASATNLGGICDYRGRLES